MEVASLSELVEFVSEYRWIYDIQVTKLFAEQWWKTIPQDWLDPLTALTVEEMNGLPFGFIKDFWPSSLKRFVLQSQRLSLPRSVSPRVAMTAINVSSKVKLGMTPKKLHEVSRLAGLVKEFCLANSCQVVLDVGSGLGYLGDCLCEQCGLSVVGLERETERVTNAKKREHSTPHYNCDDESCDPAQVSCDLLTMSHDSNVDATTREWMSYLGRLLPASLDCPFHVSVQLNVDATHKCIEKICQLLVHLQAVLHVDGAVRVCVVGLHCCGDLTPSILTLFTDHSLTSLTSLILIGCCYHKAAISRWSPSSKALTEILTARQDVLFNTFALRLAAQETKHRWMQQSDREHREHEKKVTYRAVLEAVSSGKDLPRKSLRRLKSNSIETYAKSITSELNDHHLEEKFLAYFTSHQSLMKLVEPFTALQVCLQGVLETLILKDRLSLLKERGIMSAELTAVFEPTISPRNMALVATK